MINSTIMDKLNELGFGADVEGLENYIEVLQDAAGEGKPLVTDTEYDMFIRVLKELRPDSWLLKRNWEKEDNQLGENDELLKRERMYSIQTIQKMEELSKFRNIVEGAGLYAVDLIASVKLNGHAVRAVYRYGNLVSGSTRGRYKKGRDITRHLMSILPNEIEELKDVRLAEVRGELLVSADNFELLEGKLKNRLSAVTSLIKESASDEEIKLLDFLAYKLIYCEDSGKHTETLEKQFNELSNMGFQIPIYSVYNDISTKEIDSAAKESLSNFSEYCENVNYPYAVDGIVMAVNDTETFAKLGTENNICLGNFALKMGAWESNMYKSKIIEIVFTAGKKYFTPKAIVEPTLTSNGAIVTKVPLYNVGVMEKYNLVVGSDIFFRFGGETGVSLLTPDGRLVGDMD